MDCFLAKFTPGPCDYGPRGFPDPCHLIPLSRLKRAGITDRDTLWSEAIVFPACREHHRRFDSRGGYLPKGDYPASVLAFAAEHGFVYTPRGWVEGKSRLTGIGR